MEATKIVIDEIAAEIMLELNEAEIPELSGEQIKWLISDAMLKENHSLTLSKSLISSTLFVDVREASSHDDDENEERFEITLQLYDGARYLDWIEIMEGGLEPYIDQTYSVVVSFNVRKFTEVK